MGEASMPLGINFGREVCGDLVQAEKRSGWSQMGLGIRIGNGGRNPDPSLSRVAGGSLETPLGRTLMLTKLDDTVLYGDRFYPLHANRWADGTLGPHGYRHIERFVLEGRFPPGGMPVLMRCWKNGSGCSPERTPPMSTTNYCGQPNRSP